MLCSFLYLVCTSFVPRVQPAFEVQFFGKLWHTEDNEVVEYALNGSLSPTLATQYKTSLSEGCLIFIYY